VDFQWRFGNRKPNSRVSGEAQGAKVAHKSGAVIVGLMESSRNKEAGRGGSIHGAPPGHSSTHNEKGDSSLRSTLRGESLKTLEFLYLIPAWGVGKERPERRERGVARDPTGSATMRNVKSRERDPGTGKSLLSQLVTTRSSGFRSAENQGFACEAGMTA